MPLKRANYGSLLVGCFVCVCVFVNYCASAAPQGYYYSYPNQQRRATNGYSYSQPARTQYTNNYRQQQQRQSYYYPRQNAITPPTTTTTTPRPQRYRASKADTENAKFAGIENLQSADNEESGKSLKKILKKKLLRRFVNPCSPFGRDAGADSARAEHKGQGRFLFDVNVYNVYPGANVGGLGGRPCGGYGYGFGGGGGGLLGLGGAGLGGGLLSDPIAAAPAYGGSPLSTFLGLWAPGILQSSLQQPSFADAIQRPQADFRPQPLNDRPQQAQADESADLQSDPAVDPAYNQGPLPVRRPNRIYFDSAGAPPLTPAQVLGGIATQVNGVIQQITGNVRPVYGGTYRDTRNYG